MPLESATFLADLVSTNPSNVDFRSEGDDHLRLLKATLQATLPGFAGRFRRFQSKSVGYGPVLNDNASVLRCTAGLTLTLAAVSAYSNGYELFIVADGGDVTLTPNGAEKINGQGTFVIPNGSAALLVASAIASSEFYCLTLALPVVSPGFGADITGNVTLTAGQIGGLRHITATATVTLPAASGVPTGRSMTFKSITTGDVLLAPNGSDTIEGVNASFRIPAYEVVEIARISGGWTLLRVPRAYVGELRPIAAGVTAPLGWLLADAAAVSRTTYAGAFAVLSTTHGTGDGSTTFNLPDTRGRVLMGDSTAVVAETAATSVAANAQLVASNNAKWITGIPVRVSSSGTLPTGLVAATDYWIIRVDSTHVSFASTLANAQNGTVITISGGTGNLTITTAGHSTPGYVAHTVGETGGEEKHAMSISELLSHVHSVPFAASGSAAGGANIAATGSSTNTLSTGGNVAANILPTYGVARYLVKV